MKIKNFKSSLSKKNMIWNGQNIENKKLLIIAEEVWVLLYSFQDI